MQLFLWTGRLAIAEKKRWKVLRAIPGTGTHGYLPDHPELRSAFFAMGGSVAHGCDAGVIDMRQIAPTVAGFMGVSLPGVSQPVIRCTSKL
jgi:hypothetical protein